MSFLLLRRYDFERFFFFFNRYPKYSESIDSTRHLSPQTGCTIATGTKLGCEDRHWYAANVEAATRTLDWEKLFLLPVAKITREGNWYKERWATSAHTASTTSSMCSLKHNWEQTRAVHKATVEKPSCANKASFPFYYAGPINSICPKSCTAWSLCEEIYSPVCVAAELAHPYILEWSYWAWDLKRPSHSSRTDSPWPCPSVSRGLKVLLRPFRFRYDVVWVGFTRTKLRGK